MAKSFVSRVITLHDLRRTTLSIPNLATKTSTEMNAMTNASTLDTRGRPMHDLRISITDRCNFRCSYCMPKEVFGKDHPYLAQTDLLSFEEITRVAGQFARLGVQKIRLTGGEPLLRKNLELLVAQLASLRTPQGSPLDLTLTTNGSLLARKAQALRSAGLQRVTISLDALDDTVFRRMNDVDFPVADVLAGIDAAHAAGLGPIKINMVVKRGVNEHQIIPMARYFKGSGMVLRFIEYMDVGATNGWKMDEVLPSSQVIQLMQTEFPLVALEPTTTGETASRWGYATDQGTHDTTAGEIGVISSVTQAFCSDCSRARLSTEGQLYLCLFATKGYDLRSLLRGQASDDAIFEALHGLWGRRTDRYSELRERHATPPDGEALSARVEMSYIGG